MQIFVANTNLISLLRLKSAVENDFIDDADVSVTVITAAGVEVAGETWPVTMEPAEDSPSKGDYVAVLSEEIEFEANKSYIAVVDVDAGPGRVGRWEVPFTARTRQ